MAFTGTLDKCKACDKKTVYVMDLMTLEGMPYHKSCFRCSHCSGTLVVSILMILPRLFLFGGGKTKESLSYLSQITHPWMEFCIASPISNSSSKNLETSARIFSQKMTMEGESYHKTCFRCAHGGCPLTHSSYAALNGILYCKVHFNQLFLEKGNYNHVLQAAANHRRTPEEDKTEPNESEIILQKMNVLKQMKKHES
ncbi:hypothetical protein Bca4012_039194 [Brassica carinata]